MLEVKVNLIPMGIFPQKNLENLIIKKVGIGKYKYTFNNWETENVVEGFDRDNGALGLLKYILNNHPEIKQKTIPVKSEIAKKFGVNENDLQWRTDGRIEWICKHGVGHPVYVPEKIKDWGWIHGCCSCCWKLFKENLSWEDYTLKK